jgi:bifunctional non-homologous end joining protein LigD
VYHAFDLLHLDSWDLLAVPLEERKRLLRLVLREHPATRFVSHVVGHGEDLQRAVIERGLEGSVAKLRLGPYEPGRRSRAWLKIKARREQELVIVGYEPGTGSHRDLGALLVATWEADGWRFAGQVGSGLDTRTRTLLRRLLDEHPLAESPVVGAPPMPGARWSEPRQVIRAEFTEWTSDGLLRQAVYKGRELGRDPRSVSREISERGEDAREQAMETALATAEAGPAPTVAIEEEAGDPLAAPPPRAGPPRGSPTFELVSEGGARRSPAEAVTRAELEALAGLGEAGRWEVGGHEVELTNLDKVLFPSVGLTKRDLVRYYTTIAPAILPYLRDRPLNVHRWPDGVAGRTRFWQKQIPGHAPEWVGRWEYPEAGRDRSHTYLVADRLATLAWLANQAVIDLHPWTSRIPEYWRPTYVYIDIDPGEHTAWPEVLTLARLFRTALEHLGVRGFPKVTGKRGIQVWIHVQPRYTFDDTRAWAGQLSRGVGAVVPDLVSWEWGKADRGGRARLDYTQNSPIKTLVAPYAVRPVSSAAVSAPITWDELDDPTLRPDGWDMRSIIRRVESRGDLFSGVLADPQELPDLS